MSNQATLITMAQRTPEERREISRLGVLARKRNNARRKTLRECFEAMMAARCRKNRKITAADALAMRMGQLAIMDGDVAAARLIADVMGATRADATSAASAPFVPFALPIMDPDALRAEIERRRAEGTIDVKAEEDGK